MQINSTLVIKEYQGEISQYTQFNITHFQNFLNSLNQLLYISNQYLMLPTNINQFIRVIKFDQIIRDLIFQINFKLVIERTTFLKITTVHHYQLVTKYNYFEKIKQSLILLRRDTSYLTKIRYSYLHILIVRLIEHFHENMNHIQKHTELQQYVFQFFSVTEQFVQSVIILRDYIINQYKFTREEVTEYADFLVLLKQKVSESKIYLSQFWLMKIGNLQAGLQKMINEGSFTEKI